MQYSPAELVDEMNHHGYPLQALLYLVAFRRYLRRREPRVNPDDVVAGAAYLFVRGMDPTRPASDTRGVIWWQPSGELIDAVDRLFAVEGST